MSKVWKIIFGFMVFAEAIFAQGATSVAPDCGPLNFTFTANGSNQPYNNYPTSGVNGGGVCTAWVVSYRGFSVMGSPSLVFQSAPATNSTTPGSWVTYAGTVETGVNPNTSATGAQTLFSNGAVSTPFVRLTLSGMTSGNISGVIYGYKTGSSGNGSGGGGGGSGCVGTVMTPCVVEGPAAAGAALSGNPLLDGWSDGTNAQNQFFCPNQAAITISAGTDVVVVAGTMGKNTVICHLDFASDTVATFTVRQGTGSTCGTGTAGITGAYPSIITFASDYSSVSALRTTTTGNDVCLHSSATATVGGFVVYAKF